MRSRSAYKESGSAISCLVALWYCWILSNVPRSNGPEVVVEPFWVHWETLVFQQHGLLVVAFVCVSVCLWSVTESCLISILLGSMLFTCALMNTLNRKDPTEPALRIIPCDPLCSGSRRLQNTWRLFPNSFGTLDCT